MKRLTKPAVALVAAVALLIGLAGPGAAGTVSSGTLTLGFVGLSLTAPCGAATVTTTPTSATAGTIALTMPARAFDLSGVGYAFTGTFAGSYTLAGTAITGTLAMTNGRIWTRSGTCTPTTTGKCPGPISTTIAFTGTHTGSSLTISGSGTVSAFCSAPFAALNGSTSTLSLTAPLP